LEVDDREEMMAMTSETLERPVDAAPPTTRSRPRVWTAAMAVLALGLGLFGGWLIWGGDTTTETGPLTGDFPTGVYDIGEGDTVEFRPDGTCEFSGVGWSMDCTYSVNGDLYTETTFDWPGGVQVPATYFWDFEGDELTFELWGDDPRLERQAAYSGRTFVLVD
jgi:hypothetical protein